MSAEILSLIEWLPKLDGHRARSTSEIIFPRRLILLLRLWKGDSRFLSRRTRKRNNLFLSPSQGKFFARSLDCVWDCKVNTCGVCLRTYTRDSKLGYFFSVVFSKGVGGKWRALPLCTTRRKGMPMMLKHCKLVPACGGSILLHSHNGCFAFRVIKEGGRRNKGGT